MSTTDTQEQPDAARAAKLRQLADGLEKSLVQGVYAHADEKEAELAAGNTSIAGQPITSLQQWIDERKAQRDFMISEGMTTDDIRQMAEDGSPDAGTGDVWAEVSDIKSDAIKARIKAAEQKEEEQKEEEQRSLCQMFRRVVEAKGEEADPLARQVVRILDRMSDEEINSPAIMDVDLRAYVESGAGSHRASQDKLARMRSMDRRQPKFKGSGL